MFRFEVSGNVDDGFASIEIFDDKKYLGRIFELSDGFYLQFDDLDLLKNDELIDFIKKAKAELKKYPNRKGENPPKDLSAAGFSAWLLEN